MKAERVENLVQVSILLLVGTMAGAASFTHVHDWTMANSPAGTGDWFGWANAVISELTPTAAGLEIRRRKRNGQSITYPMAVLIAAASLSIAAQLAVAKPGPTGWLLAAVPALAFLALSKLVLSRTPTRTTPEPVDKPADEPADDPLDVPATASAAIPDVPPAGPAPAVPPLERPALEAQHTIPDVPAADPIPPHLITGARMAAFNHHTTTGRPITSGALAEHLGISVDLAATVLRHLQDQDPAPAEGDRL